MKPYIKRIPAALTALLLVGQLALPGATEAAPIWTKQGDLVIAEEFADPVLRAWLLDGKNLDGAGADGVLTAQECQAVTVLNLSGLGLTSLEGLENFSNLQILDCSQNSLTTLDVSGNLALTRLYCGNNRLEQLDLSQNLALEHFSCSFNRIRRLDLTGHSALRSLNCEMNQMEELELSGCSQLLSLYCRNNQLTRLDLTDNGKLEFIETFDNRLTTIDVRHLENLRFLHIDHNRLVELDMSHNQKLEGGGFVVRNNVAERIYLPDQPGLVIDREDYEEQDPIEGHDRVAWYLDDAYTLPVPEFLMAQGQTLYSERIPNRYTIYFSANGGTGTMPGVSAQWDESLSLPQNAFRRYGYTFSHWSSQPGEDDKTYQEGETVENLAGHHTDGDRVTLYARWKANRYTIRLDPNQGEGEPLELGAAYGETVSLPKNPFQKAEKEFAGWALEANGSVRYPDQAQVQNLTAQDGETITLYAVWRTPLSQIQKPYLEELEGVFRSYSEANGEN